MKKNTIEEFKEAYIRLFKQELALKDGRSYFDVTTSNIDGTLIGEMFDNPIRISILKQMNEEFSKQVNFEELNKEAEELYKKDLEKVED